jgi:hypothetical protein
VPYQPDKWKVLLTDGAGFRINHGTAGRALDLFVRFVRKNIYLFSTVWTFQFDFIQSFVGLESWTMLISHNSSPCLVEFAISSHAFLYFSLCWRTGNHLLIQPSQLVYFPIFLAKNKYFSTIFKLSWYQLE